MTETLIEWGVRLPDGRVTAFRFEDAAREHLAWQRKMRRYGCDLVHREVTYGDWSPELAAGPASSEEGQR